MTKAFILDPFFSVDDLSGFKQQAGERQGWDFERLSFAESQADPWGYLPRVISAVEYADIILCFGDYFWFNFCQSEHTGFYDLIEQKLR